MVKHTTICWVLPTNCLSVIDHFVGFTLKGLSLVSRKQAFSEFCQTCKIDFNYLRKTLDLRCLTEFFIRLWRSKSQCCSYNSVAIFFFNNIESTFQKQVIRIKKVKKYVFLYNRKRQYVTFYTLQSSGYIYRSSWNGST